MCPIFLYRLEVSPKVESSSDVPRPLPPCSPIPPDYSSPTASPSGHVSSDDLNHTNPFTSSPSSTVTPMSPSNPFPSCMQRNPFFEELIAEELQKSPPFSPCPSLGSPLFNYTTVPSHPCTPSAAHDTNASNLASIKRDRPRPVARQISLPALLPMTATSNIYPHDPAPRSMSESAGEWEDSFDAFASSRLNSPKGSLPQKQPRTSPTSSYVRGNLTVNDAQELQTREEEPPPLPPRRLLRTPVNEIYSDGWLHRGQELAVHKEAYLLSQTGVASLQRGREGERKRNDKSPDPHTSSEASDTFSGNSQICTSMTSPGFMSNETLKAFKYEPLEDEADCWGGMLFEQDLYGRACRGNYRQPKLKSHHLSVNIEETSQSKFTSMNSGPKMLLADETSVADLLNLSCIPMKPNAKVPDLSTTQTEMETESISPETTGINNISFSLTIGDLNMNVNNSDFSFIDSDGSSQSEAVDTFKCVNSFSGNVPKSSELVAAYHAETPQDVFTLKDTYIPEMNSSFECHNCQCELNNSAPTINSAATIGWSSQKQTISPDLECSTDLTSSLDGFIKTHKDFDDNGNPQRKIGTHNQVESFSGVVSARLRPKGVSRQNSNGSPNNQTKSEDREFEELLSLVQNISGVSEGPMSYQPTKSTLSTLLAFNNNTDLQGDSANEDQTHHEESNSNSHISKPVENCKTGKSSEISFEDLHAKVAPNLRTPSKIGQSLKGPDPSSPSMPCTVSQSADAQALPHPNPLCHPSIHPSSMGSSAGASTTLTLAPYTSYSITSNTDQPLVDARHSLLPEETQPASNLPHQESR